MVFKSLHRDYEIPFKDELNRPKFKRQMRAYLIKDEGTLEMLASQKFEEDLQNKHKMNSKGAISSIEAHSSSFGSIVSRGVHSNGDLRGRSRGGSSLRQRGAMTSGFVASPGHLDSEELSQ